MIITAVRFRSSPDAPWQAVKLGAGIGRYRNYQCVQAAPGVLEKVASALVWAVTGEAGAQGGLHEVTLLLNDDAGDAWAIERRASDKGEPATRIVRNGEVPPSGEHALRAALLDLDPAEVRTKTPPQIARFLVHGGENGVRVAPQTAEHELDVKLKAEVTRQIKELAEKSAEVMQAPALASPQKLSRLSRALEPVHARWLALVAEAKDVAALGGAGTPTPAEAEKLQKEIELAAKIDADATPLLKPGVSLKAMEAELARAEAEIGESCAALGVETPDAAPLDRDLRKPLEAMVRLEAYARLVRASQGARKYCEQNLEPAFKKYVETAEAHLVHDRQIMSELESCLATLNLKLRADAAREAAAKAEPEAPQAGLRTWFDRFKARGDDARREPVVDPSHEEETAKMALEYALGRLAELGAGVNQARSRFEGAFQRIDQAHEELVQQYGRLKDHWRDQAKKAELPEEMDLAQLTALCIHQAGLSALIERRKELTIRVRDLKARTGRLERLVADWRALTGSQKQSDLGDQQMLLQEARDIIRYRDAKAKRLAQIRAGEAVAKAKSELTGAVEKRRAAVEAEWRKAFADCGVPVIAPDHPAWADCFRRGSLVRALALVHGPKTEGPKPFDASTEANALTVYSWMETTTPQKARLDLLNHLEQAAGGELRVLMVADPSVAAMLVSLGVGAGVTVPVNATKPAPAAPAKPAPTQAPKGLVQDRARVALDILTGKTKG